MSAINILSVDFTITFTGSNTVQMQDIVWFPGTGGESA